MDSNLIEWELMPDDIAIKVGKNVKALRLKKGLTQVQLGLLCEPPIIQQSIAKYENSTLTPALETLARIAKALRVDIKELL